MVPRAQQFEQLNNETFDLAIIGGGINGAAIARDAALRGLSVALIDRGDFAGATSSHSSKLIHGGLRYLPQGQIRLVYHALRERERLRRLTAPHLVGPIRFLFPFCAGRRPSRFAVSAGLILYDLFARTPSAERHRRVSKDEMHVLEPGLASERLRGGAIYFDGWGDDARLTLENLIDAALHGGTILNYAEAESFEHKDGRITAAEVRDVETGSRSTLRARCFVNAAGPWLDSVRQMDDPSARPVTRLTKGVHLVVSAARLPINNALVLTDDSGRIVFVMPYEGWTVIGTTDTDYAGDPAKVRAEVADSNYLIDVANQALPTARLRSHDVAYSFAGLRVLPRADGRQMPSAVAREEVLIESASGLISLGGGKLTSHRAIGERIGTLVLGRLGRSAAASPTRSMPLPGARPAASANDNGADEAGIRTRYQWLDRRYGSRATLVASIAHDRPELAMPLASDAPAIGAEVLFAITHEWSRTVSDFLIRRTAMAWRNPPAAIASAPAVARIMGETLGWDPVRMTAELESFAAQMNQTGAYIVASFDGNNAISNA
jgi:glycerol-3-phosphate dehydrogenase